MSRLRLSDFFLRSDVVQSKDNYDSFIRGMLTQHAQGQDQFFTTEVFYFRVILFVGKNYYFEIKMFIVSLDNRIPIQKSEQNGWR